MKTPTLAILLGLAVVVLTLLLAAVPADAAAQQPQEDAAFLRVPVGGEGDELIPRLRARVRHTTLIVLPAGERILDFVVGDSEYWHLTGAANVAYLKPLAEDGETNVALVCESGRIYSFLVSEHGEKPPHLVVRVDPGAESPDGVAGAPGFVARSEVVAYRRMAAEAAEAARRARVEAEAGIIEAGRQARAEIEAFRAGYPGRLRFEYRLDSEALKRPFLVEAMWHDGRFTYIRSRAQEAPALYELKDGEPALVAFDLSGDGLYVARHVLDDGWLQIGDRRLRWRFEPGEENR
ncbi:MAG: TrbG/VirB9 family P-type conjugative transfer protein [Gemmatimonadota bacterium]|uniref:TrbG/VirB9 family P-type conjugative transfer protein n=1 Tax=Candidatus Palauibacter soopunensis TaxID=3056739 RepID=UPI00238B548E|nr:TrbG/VirB9 family P-type conjugative transfer protein [Candidatus Palauibacter soopunensis]MDE2784436.1 TrbG/VirB9 family P-type conjugative transfer protein [Gemmatimonadota bacterium]MDE2879050.1 TrbG/VirB9 family P-type conjugative transfer protein [Candidatus Palauibacter soopunensis]